MCVGPVRSSTTWKRVDERSPFGFCSVSHPCVTPFVTYIAPLGLGTVHSCFPGICPPKKRVQCSSKDASLSGHSETVATPEANCLKHLGVPPEPSEATNMFWSAYWQNSLLSHPGFHAACVFTCRQPISWHQSTTEQNLIRLSKIMSQPNRVDGCFHVLVCDHVVARTFPQLVLSGSQDALLTTNTKTVGIEPLHGPEHPAHVPPINYLPW